MEAVGKRRIVVVLGASCVAAGAGLALGSVNLASRFPTRHTDLPTVFADMGYYADAIRTSGLLLAGFGGFALLVALNHWLWWHPPRPAPAPDEPADRRPSPPPPVAGPTFIDPP